MNPGAADRADRAGTLAAAVADFLLPPACAGCGGAVGGRAEGPVCRNCRLRLPPVPLPACNRCGAPLGTGEAPSCLECADWPDALSAARAACLLESPARELVHALKYQGWREVGDRMAAEMARRAPSSVLRAELIVPIPTSARNRRRRGYNQAGVIAAALSRELGIPLLDRLERGLQRGTQTALNPMQRRANVSGAFALSDGCEEAVAGRRILLVDDVITTGATILSAVAALAPASPADVAAYSFARTVPISLETA